ncbi:hypothetical protein [Xylocopilactobacillus apis]|uniref:Uncharacterized protein n=1 Tax=Xylocopilactobacillus apis TaxID=2932183 RepID=A0AAU9D582_9LACO|nr:hypothetical protein [Xylocopilactobacillus apis]BDR55967.1 hypothetical protein KIMC2_05290 [Xylocopilactobacillus apis]
MKKNLKIPIEFIHQTNEGRTVVTYSKESKVFSIFIPVTDIIDWSKTDYREINFDSNQDYEVIIADPSPAVKPMGGTIKGDVLETDLNRLVQYGSNKGIS